jgi:beta-glucanase (GH16 family)
MLALGAGLGAGAAAVSELFDAGKAGAGPRAWSDAFDGPAGTPPGLVWSPVTNGDGGGNQELEYYMPQANRLDGNGHLVISANRDSGTHAAWYGPSQYTSGKVWTRGRLAFRYGHLEVKAAFPCAGQGGAWPAIWMLGADVSNVGWPSCGEIDIFESFGKNADSKQVSAAVHCRSGNKQAYFELPADNDATQLHTYTLDWLPEQIVLGVDGNHYLTVDKKDMGVTWPFQQPFFLILNLAIGGTGGGAVPSTAVFPYTAVFHSVNYYGGEVYEADGLLG